MFDIEALVQTAGYFGLFAIIFAETGLMLGFFLPGDSLLFTAGFLASQGFLDISLLCLGLFIAAVTGNCSGYFIGHKFGRRLFHREDSLLFHKNHLQSAKAFYEKHGGKTIILARFLPIIRTFAPIVAGIGEMPFPIFLTYSLIGGAIWAVGLPLTGYFLGRLIPDIDKILLPIIGLIIVISLLPTAFHTLKTRQQRKDAYTVFMSLLKKILGK